VRLDEPNDIRLGSTESHGDPAPSREQMSRGEGTLLHTKTSTIDLISTREENKSQPHCPSLRRLPRPKGTCPFAQDTLVSCNDQGRAEIALYETIFPMGKGIEASK
jgi:hypothetical protein